MIKYVCKIDHNLSDCLILKLYKTNKITSFTTGIHIIKAFYNLFIKWIIE